MEANIHGTKPPLPVTIGKMTAGDLPSVLSVEKEAFPHHPYEKDEYDKFLADPKIDAEVARDGNKIIGFTVMEIGRGGPWERPLEDPKKSYLNEIAVSSEAHGRKVGEQLLLHALSACIGAGAASCTLWVLEELKGAQSLYRKFGFEDTGGRETKHYAAGDKVAMRMKVDGLQTPAYRKKIAEIRQDLSSRMSGQPEQSAA